VSTLADKVLATSVNVTESALVVHLADGRTISVPLEWFPRLKAATAEQRGRWTLIGRGIGIEWADIDEHISVENLLLPLSQIRFFRPR
jgi:hypothetical protein